MPTLAQAQTAFSNTRRYYKLGVKSSNKRYEGHQYGASFLNTEPEESLVRGNPKPITLDEAHVRVARRLLNNSHSGMMATAGKNAAISDMNVAIVDDISPFDYGRLMVNQQNDAGNCGVMACVAIYYANLAGVPLNQMWSVTAENPTTTYGKYGKMLFGHSWAQLGTGGQPDCVIVDPWAGVVCKELDYVTTLKSHLDQWFRQGKRIATQWSDNHGKQVWLNANHETVLSLLETGSERVMIRADQTNGVTIKGQFPRRSFWSFS
jgi:hypothetical protein